jgi:hypothetical protein
MLLPSTLPNKIGNHDCQFLSLRAGDLSVAKNFCSYIKVSAKTIALDFLGFVLNALMIQRAKNSQENPNASSLLRSTCFGADPPAPFQTNLHHSLTER